MSRNEKLARRGIFISPYLGILGILVLLAAAIYRTITFMNPVIPSTDPFSGVRIQGSWENIPVRPRPSTVDQPKVAQPKVETPEIDKPKVDKPKVDNPKVDKPKVEKPKVEKPKVEKPKLDQPKADRPKLDKPKAKPKGPLRFDPARPGSVYCWPSVGGIIIAPHVHSVELAFLGLDKGEPVAKASDKKSEDEFCRQLRKLGAKWWVGYDDWEAANVRKSRKMTPEEAEVVYLGWPESGGVWVLSYENSRVDLMKRGQLANALTMDERCDVIEMSGGEFFAKPKDSEIVRPLLEEFGEPNKRSRKRQRELVVGGGDVKRGRGYED